MRILTYIFALVLLSSCLKDESLNKDYAGYSPRDIGDNWEIGDAKSNNVDSNALNRVFQNTYNDYNNWPMRSLLVFRNNKLIAETYFKDESDRTKRRAVWSCTKQVMGLLAGFMFDENIIFQQDRLEQVMEPYLRGHADKKNILIEEVLTMRTGIGFHNDEHSDVFRKKKTNNSIRYVLNLELEADPGTRFNYNDGDPQLFSAIIQEMTGKTASAYAKEKLFSKIGFENYEWASYIDGLSLGAFGILTSPRELAKIGQFVLNKGRWDSTQIISEQYIDEMLSEKAKDSEYPQLSFGFYWWTNPQKNYYIMWGHGGQYVFIMPDKNAMVVITSLEQVASEYAVWIENATGIADQVNKCLN